jgi:hypothetical protein
LMVAIFIDDREKYETALKKQTDLVRSYIMNANGCCDESSRDQAHAMMGFGFLAETAEAAWHQGDDLYSAHGNRIYYAYELHAKYNLGNSVSGCSMNSKFRGSVDHTIWEYAYNHYHNRLKMDMPWTEQYIMKKMRPEGLTDKELPWGTLTYANLGKLDGPIDPNPTITFNLQLLKGWNLISLPIEPNNNGIDKVLSGIDGKFSAVHAYDGTNYQSYVPGASGNTLPTMSAGTGYWIFMTEAATLEIKGKAASKTTQLKKDWNLVGYNSTQSASVEQALKSIEGKYSAVYGFDTVQNRYIGYVPGSTSNELTTLQPGKGYWIFVPSAETWTLP